MIHVPEFSDKAIVALGGLLKKEQLLVHLLMIADRLVSADELLISSLALS
jgi:hypothetical protein